MKNYNEITNNLLERRDRYVAEQKERRKRLTGTIASLCSICLIALVGFGMWQIGIFDRNPPITVNDSTNVGEKDYYAEVKEDDVSTPSSEHAVSEELQKQIDQLESQSMDTIGWIVYDGRIYLQIGTVYDGIAYGNIPSIDVSNVEPNQYLGRAIEFQGSYGKEEDGKMGDGELYSVSDNPDLIFVKLENGAIIVLSANY